MWRPLENVNVLNCMFQYAVSKRSECEGCKKNITFKSLRAKVENGTNFYHFECFWKYETTAKCNKGELMIAVEPPPMYNMHCKTFWGHSYISLEVLDQNIPGIKPLLRQEDIDRIRDYAALAQEGKTPYYTPDVVRKWWSSASCCLCVGSEYKCAKNYGLRYDKAFYHLKCLAESGIVNVDAEDIKGCSPLDEDEKLLFKKKAESGPIFMAHTKFGLEHCALKTCISKPNMKERAIKSGELRIRYGHFSYHPQCFASLGIVNVNGQETTGDIGYCKNTFFSIPNFDNMSAANKLVLQLFFIKSDDFNIPLVEKANVNGYCGDCRNSKASSHFPYPYTISSGQLQIRFQGNIYHPTCFRDSDKIDVATNEMRNYESLDHAEKEIIDEIFKKTQKRKSTEDQSTVATKKKKSMEGNEEIDADIKAEIKQETSFFSVPESVDNVEGFQSAETTKSEEPSTKKKKSVEVNQVPNIDAKVNVKHQVTTLPTPKYDNNAGSPQKAQPLKSTRKKHNKINARIVSKINVTVKQEVKDSEVVHSSALGPLEKFVDFQVDLKKEAESGKNNNNQE